MPEAAMTRFVVLLAILVVTQPAAAQGPDLSMRQQLERLLERGQYQALIRSCGALPDDARRAECLRALEACSRPGEQAASADCVRTMWTLRYEEICNTDELKGDKVACLERKVDALTRELAQLQRDLPRLIEEGIRAALEPRLHR
jgi:hypothetical protein